MVNGLMLALWNTSGITLEYYSIGHHMEISSFILGKFLNFSTTKYCNCLSNSVTRTYEQLKIYFSEPAKYL